MRPTFHGTRAALAALVMSGLAACSEAPPPWQQESYVFGTRVELKLNAATPQQAQQAAAAVLAELDRLHRLLHPWQPDSDAGRLNRALAAGQPYRPSPELLALLRSGQALEARSDGLFSPAIGRLVALWGFHQDTPASTAVDMTALQALVASRPRLRDLTISADGEVRSAKTTLQVDVGGMAKGWALDRARRQLQAAGGASFVRFVEALAADACQQALRHALASASLCVMEQGCVPPGWEAARAWNQQHPAAQDPR